MQNTTTTCSTFNDGHEVQLMMAHPDGAFQITMEHINDDVSEYGVLRVTDDYGVTVVVTLGALGLIELGVDLIQHAKQMIE